MCIEILPDLSFFVLFGSVCMLEESISIFKVPRNDCMQSLNGDLSNLWTYDNMRLVRRRDNPNKETLMNIPNFAYGHSPITPIEKSV